MRSTLPLLLALACTPPAPTTPPPSVLLLTLGATSADRLGPYGSPLAHTPNIDALAARGTTFNRAYTTAPQTLPAIVSVLTGLTPPAHGVRNDGDFVLSPSVQTLPETLLQAGYTTAAFTATFTTDGRWGLDQGFVHYRDVHDHPDARLLHRRSADEVVDEALALLPNLSGPVFAWIHLDDPNPPAHWDAGEHAGSSHAVLTYQDAQVGRLIDTWRALHPHGLVVLTADHGQGSGYLLEDAMLRVPLILSGPGIEAAHTIDTPVSLIDIAPTVRAMTGLAPGDLEGIDLRKGGTSLPYSESLAGQYALGLAPIYAWTDVQGRFVQGAWSAYYPATGPLVQDQSIGTDLDAHAATLLRLRKSLGQGPVQGAVISTAERVLLRNLNALYGDALAPAGLVDPRDAERSIDQIERAAIRRDQGLLRDANELLSAGISAMPEAWGARLNRATLANERGHPVTTLLALESMWADRATTSVAVLLAELHETRLERDEAAYWWRQADAIGPASTLIYAGLLRTQSPPEQWGEALISLAQSDPQVQLLWAEYALDSGAPKSALAQARRVQQALPWSARAKWIEGEALWQLGHTEPAIDALYRAVEESPWHAHYRLQLGKHLRTLSRDDQALRVLAPVARRLPDNPAITAVFESSRVAWIGARKKVRRPGTGYTSVKRGAKP